MDNEPSKWKMSRRRRDSQVMSWQELLVDRVEVFRIQLRRWLQILRSFLLWSIRNIRFSLDEILCVIRRRFESDEHQELLHWLRTKISKRYLLRRSSLWNDKILLCVLAISKLENATSTNFCSHGGRLERDKVVQLDLGPIKGHLNSILMKNASGLCKCKGEAKSRQKLLKLLSLMKTASSESCPEFDSKELCQQSNIAQVISENRRSYSAKGTGLTSGVTGGESQFTIFIADFRRAYDIMMEVKGPGNSSGTIRLKCDCEEELSRVAYSSGNIHRLNTTIEGDIPFRYEVHSDGITASYIPLVRGRHDLTIVMHGHHIEGSPYAVDIEDCSTLRPKKKVLTRSNAICIDERDDEDFPHTESKPVTGLGKKLKDGRKVIKVVKKRILRYIITLGGKEVVVENIEDLNKAVRNSKQVITENSLDSRTKIFLKSNRLNEDLHSEVENTNPLDLKSSKVDYSSTNNVSSIKASSNSKSTLSTPKQVNFFAPDNQASLKVHIDETDSEKFRYPQRATDKLSKDLTASTIKDKTVVQEALNCLTRSVVDHNYLNTAVRINDAKNNNSTDNIKSKENSNNLYYQRLNATNQHEKENKLGMYNLRSIDRRLDDLWKTLNTTSFSNSKKSNHQFSFVPSLKESFSSIKPNGIAAQCDNIQPNCLAKERAFPMKKLKDNDNTASNVGKHFSNTKVLLTNSLGTNNLNLIGKTKHHLSIKESHQEVHRPIVLSTKQASLKTESTSAENLNSVCKSPIPQKLFRKQSNSSTTDLHQSSSEGWNTGDLRQNRYASDSNISWNVSNRQRKTEISFEQLFLDRTKFWSELELEKNSTLDSRSTKNNQYSSSVPITDDASVTSDRMSIKRAKQFFETISRGIRSELKSFSKLNNKISSNNSCEDDRTGTVSHKSSEDEMSSVSHNSSEDDRMGSEFHKSSQDYEMRSVSNSSSENSGVVSHNLSEDDRMGSVFNNSSENSKSASNNSSENSGVVFHKSSKDDGMRAVSQHQMEEGAPLDECHVKNRIRFFEDSCVSRKRSLYEYESRINPTTATKQFWEKLAMTRH